MENVIITGASGFIGKALTKKLLEEGNNVYAVVRKKEKLKGLLEYKNLIPVECELSQYKELSSLIPKDSYQSFFHFAWEGTFGESFKDYHMQLKNAAYAGDAINAAITLGCKKFILAGTIVELEVKRYINMDSCKPRISCIYGTSKLAAEMLCKTIAFNNGIEFNTAIIASVYGEGDYSRMIQNVLISSLNKGIPPRLIEGNNKYDWVYIEDAVNGIISIAEKGINQKTYYLGHRNLPTFKELVIALGEIVNPSVKLVFGTIKDETFTDYSLIDLDALYNDTGFECKANFRDSILKTAEWVKSLDM